MYLRNIEILEDIFDEIKNLIIAIDEPCYTNVFENGIQYVYEKHSSANGNNYTVVVLIIQHKDKLAISFIGSGASNGRFIKFDWGTEKNGIVEISNEIEGYCRSNSIEFHLIDDEYLE
jgi:hypothetical protein